MTRHIVRRLFCVMILSMTMAASAQSRTSFLSGQFFDHTGSKITFDPNKIKVLMFVYTNCQSSCSTLTQSTLEVWKQLQPEQKEKAEFISITFDWKDNASDLLHFRQHYGLPDQWLTIGSDAQTLQSLMEDFHFQILSKEKRDFAHPSRIYFLDSEFRRRSVYEGATISFTDFKKGLDKAQTAWSLLDQLRSFLE